MLAVLVERGGTDHMQLASRQRRLEQVGGVDRPFRLAGAHEGVHLVDEHHVAPLGIGQLLDHRLEALLELAAILGPGQQQADVERDDLLPLERVGDVARDDPLGQSLDDRGLADTGLTDQHRIVLGPARQDLHHAADLLVATDHRIELPLAGEVGEVAREAIQRLVLRLRFLIGHPMRPTDLGQRVAQPLGIETLVLDQPPRRGPLLLHQRQQQVLGGDVLVAQLLGDLLGPVEHLRHRPVEGRRLVAPLLTRKAGDLRLDLVGQPRHHHAGLLEHRLDDAILLGQERSQQVGIVDHRIAPIAGVLQRATHRLLRLERQPFWTKHELDLLWSRLRWARRGPPEPAETAAGDQLGGTTSLKVSRKGAVSGNSTVNWR